MDFFKSGYVEDPKMYRSRENALAKPNSRSNSNLDPTVILIPYLILYLIGFLN